MKKALVLFIAVVIGIAFTVTGFAQEKVQPAPKVEQQVQTDKPVDKPVKTKKAKKKVKKPKKVKKTKAAPPAEEKPAETK